MVAPRWTRGSAATFSAFDISDNPKEGLGRLDQTDTFVAEGVIREVFQPHVIRGVAGSRFLFFPWARLIGGTGSGSESEEPGGGDEDSEQRGKETVQACSCRGN
jgi:hypothetical protein